MIFDTPLGDLRIIGRRNDEFSTCFYSGLRLCYIMYRASSDDESGNGLHSADDVQAGICTEGNFSNRDSPTDQSLTKGDCVLCIF